MPHTLYVLILLLLVAGYLVETALDALNARQWKPARPDELAPFYTPEEYGRARDYNRQVHRLHLVSSCFSVAVLLVLFAGGLFGKLDDLVHEWVPNPVIAALTFFGILALGADLLSLPFSIIRTFRIEQRFGFNKMTPRTFVLDHLKGYLLAIVLGGAIGGFLLWLVERLGSEFWLYAWLTVTVVLLFVQTFYTSVIVPIFNKLAPLASGSLRTRIESYAASVNFPLANILVMDGSRRSTKANAYFTGIGRTKTIVLFDTLIEKHSEEELVSVLAHEVGHYKRKHIIKGIAMSVLQIGLTLFLLSLCLKSTALSQAFGATDRRIELNILGFSLLYEPVSLVLGLLTLYFSRRHEYEADAYARETSSGPALQHALTKLSVDNLSNLLPHPLYVIFHYSHPPVLARFAALAAARQTA